MNHVPRENDPTPDITYSDNSFADNGNKLLETETIRASLCALIARLPDAKVRALWDFLAVLRLLLCCLAGLALD